MKLYQKVFIGLIAGILVGYMFKDVGGYLKPVGDIFIRCLRMIVVPLIFSTLVIGVYNSDVKNLAKYGIQTIVYFLLTTALAVTIGLIVANFINPGVGLELGDMGSIKEVEPVSFSSVITNMFPINPMASFANASVLQIIVFAIFFGTAMSLIGEKSKPVASFFDSISEIMFKISDMVINLAPYGVFALMAWTSSKYGLDIIIPMLELIFTAFIASLFHIIITYTSIVKFIGRISPIDFFKKTFEPAIVGFSTCSAAAAFPLTMRAQNQLGVPKKVSSFTLPIALTINMDGTAIYQAVAAIFIANAFGIELTIAQQSMIVLTAVLASVGTASIPGGGLIMLIMVLESVGLPLEGIALVAGIDRILDMFRTTTNVIGDNTSGIVISSLNSNLDRKIAATPLSKLENI